MRRRSTTSWLSGRRVKTLLALGSVAGTVLATGTVWSLSSAVADYLGDRQGRVTSSLCPYSCKTKGIPKKRCKDWREGDRCYVEDLTKKSKRKKIQPIAPVEPIAPRNSGSRMAPEKTM